MKTISALIFLFTLVLSSALPAQTISCTHAELCRLVQQLAEESHLSGLKTETLINMAGDPHEYEPATAEIKKLLSAPILLTGPTELNPWMGKIQEQRSKNASLKTLSLLFEKKHRGFYPQASGEALSHFWLYPKIYCEFKAQLAAELLKLGEKITTPKCEAGKIEAELARALKATTYPMILTHDALLPLLSSLDPAHQIVAIKGSGHHEEVSSAAIKKMYKALEAPTAIWVVENNIHIPQNILSKKRTGDIVITLETGASAAAPFSTLSELATKLTALGTKK